ncbi:MAG: type II toxin-antitoxin system HicB family antitoxin [Pseudomonadota bacterium]
MNIQYGCVIKQDDDGIYVVSFPDMPEAITQGETLEEALFNAAEVLNLTIEGRIDEGMEIPEPSHGEFTHILYPSARIQAALLIRFSRGDHSLAELARALETSWPSVARLEDPTHWPTLRQLDKAAKALGKKLVINLEDLY